MKRFLPVLLTCILLLSSAPLPIAAAEIGAGDVVILYTNDVHSYLANDTDKPAAISYDNIAALEADMRKLTNDVILVDAGDHVQGTAYGAMDEGATVIELMNAAGYDVATLGNHEFDYGMARTLAITGGEAEFPYVSCNFVDLRTGETVLEPSAMVTGYNAAVAFVGITTPATITSSAPAYFADEAGVRIYDIRGGADGAELYAAVQAAVDAARSAGADYVIALGHLGIDHGAGDPWSSAAVIANTVGIDAFIDGHSHSEIPCTPVQNKAGQPISLTQTGSYLDKVGRMVIHADGSITTELLETYAAADDAVTAMRDDWAGQVDERLGQPIARCDVDFTVNDGNGRRAVRVRETNLGDLVADAYYYYMREVEQLDCDVALINGGGVRADAPAGMWTYKTVKTVNPFGNVLCLMEITGQQLLDALEWGARETMGIPGENENGGFMHVAGLRYRINTSIPSTVQASTDGIWTGGPSGAYRVYDVAVYDREAGQYRPLDRSAIYTVAGSNFTLRDFGDGCAMFRGAALVKDYIVEDYMAIARYAADFRDNDGIGYANVSTANSPLAAYPGYLLDYAPIGGSGRISIADAPVATPATGDGTVLVVGAALAALWLGCRGLRARKKDQIF